MICCFLKKEDESLSKCEIIKFEDRIWLNEKGDADILRTIIIRQDSENHPISGIRIVVPYSIKKYDFTDLSNTLLRPDFFWNQRQTGEFQVDELESRQVTYDGIKNVVVPEACGSSLKQLEDLTIIQIDFSEVFSEVCNIGLRFRTRKLGFAEWRKGQFALYFNSNYLSAYSIRDWIRGIDKDQMEIAVRPLLEERFRTGGFDVFVIPPEEYDLQPKMPSSSSPTFASHNIDGNKSEKIPAQCWRLRLAVSENQDKTIAVKSDGGLIVCGEIYKKSALFTIDKSLNFLTGPRNILVDPRDKIDQGIIDFQDELQSIREEIYASDLSEVRSLLDRIAKIEHIQESIVPQYRQIIDSIAGRPFDVLSFNELRAKVNMIGKLLSATMLMTAVVILAIVIIAFSLVLLKN